MLASLQPIEDALRRGLGLTPSYIRLRFVGVDRIEDHGADHDALAARNAHNDCVMLNAAAFETE